MSSDVERPRNDLSDDDRQEGTLHTDDLLPGRQGERGNGPDRVAAVDNDVDGDDLASSPTTATRDTAGRDSEAPMALLEDTADLEERWTEIQTRFVDEPRAAVEDADALVADVMHRLATMFAAERQNMEREWQAGDDVSTEDLRLAFQRYRSFFQRLLAV